MCPLTRFGLLFVVACLAPLICARVARAPASESQTRTRRQQSGGDQYGWVCPTVVCPTLSDTCQTVEFFTMEYGYSTESSGQAATITCRSCEYCLDVPNTDSTRRGRRNAPHHRRHDCTTVTCPEVPSSCNDIRMTDVLLGSTKCRQCPACYDNTLFNRST